MGILDWFGQHWFDFFQTVAVVGSLIFTGIALRDETRARRITNLLTLTENHREIWSSVFHFPGLARVLDESPDLGKNPARASEQLFVMLVIHHLHSTFQSMKDGLVVKPKSLCRDVASFFGLPIPNAVWKQVKDLQDDDFAAFVESCLESK
jgi:hypothetical protein